METIDTLRAEHSAVLYVLEQLELASAAAAAARPVPKGVFADIDEFFRVFVDKCHHGKEESVLFPRLAERDLRQRLEEEHEQGRDRARAYAASAAAYSPGDVASAMALQQAAAAYADLLRKHIATENDWLLPAVENELPTQDRELSEAFERIEIDRIGPGTHERLHGMIETLAGRIAPFAGAAGNIS